MTPNGPTEILRRRIDVALGRAPADLLLTGGQAINVFTRRIEQANVAIADEHVAYVGKSLGPAKTVIDLGGRFVIPGLIDTHMHLESTLLSPAELSRLIVPHGTTAVISDSHEIGNVMGVPGIDMLIAASEGIPLAMYFMASSCVPATNLEDAGAVIGPAEVRELLRRDRVLGLAEVMDVPATLAGAGDILEKLLEATLNGYAVDGHAPNLPLEALLAYAAAGIRSDHESTTPAEARAKAELGMLVQVREGSSAQNLDAILPLLASGEIDDAWCLVTDDVFPHDLRRHGHINGLLRKVVAGGVRPEIAVRHASIVPARHYHLRDRGAVAPGFRADLAVVNDLVDFVPSLVVASGKIAAREGCYLGEPIDSCLDLRNTIRPAPVDASAFSLRLSSATCPVIEIVPDQIVTRFETREVKRSAGIWTFDPAIDVVLIASRH